MHLLQHKPHEVFNGRVVSLCVCSVPLSTPAPLQSLPMDAPAPKGLLSHHPCLSHSSPAPPASLGAPPGSAEQEKLNQNKLRRFQMQREGKTELSCSCAAPLCVMELGALKPIAGILKNKKCPCHSGSEKWLIWILFSLPHWRCPQTPRISPESLRYQVRQHLVCA